MAVVMHPSMVKTMPSAKRLTMTRTMAKKMVSEVFFRSLTVSNDIVEKQFLILHGCFLPA